VVESVTLEDVERAEIAMEAGRVKVALSGGEATKTETPGEPDGPSSIEQAEADVTEALDTIARQQSEDAAASETETDTFRQSSTGPSEGTADTPVSPAPTSSGSVPPAAGADAEIARLQAHVEDLRRENGMLWDQVRHEREARIREIELLNGMIHGMRR
jgi:FtsZ-binding cell division protein ZapB